MREVVLGDAAALEPARAALKFALGRGEDQVKVDVTIGTLRFAARGTIRVSGQAIVQLRTGPT